MRGTAVCLKSPAETSKNARHPVLDGMPGVFCKSGASGSCLDSTRQRLRPPRQRAIVSTDAPHSSNCVSTFCSIGNLYAIAFTKRFCVFCSSRGNNSTSEIRYFTRSRRSAAFILSYADRANERLRRRYYRMTLKNGAKRNVAIVAVARELACFIWGMMTDEIA